MKPINITRYIIIQMRCSASYFLTAPACSTSSIRAAMAAALPLIPRQARMLRGVLAVSTMANCGGKIKFLLQLMVSAICSATISPPLYPDTTRA